MELSIPVEGINRAALMVDVPRDRAARVRVPLPRERRLRARPSVLVVAQPGTAAGTMSLDEHRARRPAVSDQGELVRRAIALEPEAVRALVTLLRPTIQVRVGRALMRTMRKGRSAAQEVEDMIQEVFLALFDNDCRALRAWDSTRPLEPFVAIIADHEVASILRSGRRKPWRDDHDGAIDVDTFTTHHGSPESIVGTTELYDSILARLRAELSPKGLELFTMLIVEEQPVEDVCAATSMNRDAVYAWRSRLLKLVKKLALELSSTGSDRMRAAQVAERRAP